MKTVTKSAGGLQKTRKPLPAHFVERVWEESWTYIKTVVDIVREPILILDKNLCVMTANDSFYRTFQVESSETENKLVYNLGNGQWDIPELRKLLEDILPKNSFFKGFEVDHVFPLIGRKVMILNARRIHFKEDSETKLFPPTIFLAIEDATDMMAVADTLADHAKQFEARLTEQTERLEVQILGLVKEINLLKKPRGSFY
ncbi:MAG: PAS domain-containing protein [bacterium]|nr:PAS domain-containing protein [bacterium]